MTAPHDENLPFYQEFLAALDGNACEGGIGERPIGILQRTICKLKMKDFHFENRFLLTCQRTRKQVQHPAPVRNQLCRREDHSEGELRNLGTGLRLGEATRPRGFGEVELGLRRLSRCLTPQAQATLFTGIPEVEAPHSFAPMATINTHINFHIVLCASPPASAELQSSSSPAASTGWVDVNAASMLQPESAPAIQVIR